MRFNLMQAWPRLPGLIVAVALLLGAGCSGGAAPELDGKWKVLSVLGDGTEMGEGDNWFHFQPDGKATVMLNYKEDKGSWQTEPENTTLVVKSDHGGENRYDYRFSGDTLFLKSVVGKSHQLQFICLRQAE